MKKRTKRRLLAVASRGGHWMQLCRICTQLEDTSDIVYVSTEDMSGALPAGAVFHQVADFSRQDFWRMIPAGFSLFRILLKEKPDAILTTGAAPGLIAIAIGRMMGMRTIWVDSIANAGQLSGSGKIACHIAGHVFTQWPYLAEGNVEYHGNILGI